MKWSSRIPGSFTTNAWSAALAERRRLGLDVLDLTEGNPTAAGLSDEAGWLEGLADPRSLRYTPEPRGLESAREAVCRCYAEQGVSIAPRDVVLTTGTSESYAHLFRLLCDPGDTVLVPRPGYPLFEALAAAEGVEVGSYRLVRRGSPFELDRESLERAAPRVRALIVVQPNPPAGSCLDADEIAFVDDWCARHDVALISDEVFGGFPRDGSPESARPLPTLLGDRRATTFVLNGVSKWCGLPQLKLGWIIACGPDRARLLDGLEWISDLFLSVGAPVQHALPRILEARHGFRKRTLERLRLNIETLTHDTPAGVTVWPADGGWSAIVELPDRHDDEAWAMRFLDGGVAVHPGHFYDLEEKSCVVVSLITRPEILKAGWARLEEEMTRP